MLFLALAPPPEGPAPGAEAARATPAMDALPPPALDPAGSLGAVLATEGSGPRDFRPEDDCFWGEIGALALLDEEEVGGMPELPPPVMDEWCCDEDNDDDGGGDGLTLS